MTTPPVPPYGSADDPQNPYAARRPQQDPWSPYQLPGGDTDRGGAPGPTSPGAVDEGVLVDPADTGCIGTQGRACARRQSRRDLAQVFQHAASRPIEVGAFGEEDVDVGIPEHRIAADGDRARHR